MEQQTVSLKEAAFMLDTDMAQDMKTYGQEVTRLAIKYINSNPTLYKRMKEARSMADEAVIWAERHNDEFGDLFISELSQVKWREVKKRV